MSCLSGEYNPDIGVLLQVGIVPGGTSGAVQRPEGTRDAVAIRGSSVSALVDTGASRTAIASKLATELGLEPDGKFQVRGVTGAKMVNSYTVDFVLRFGPQSMVVNNFEVLEFDSGNFPYQVLLGRDVLCRGVFTMDFAGRFTFSI